MAHRPLPPGEIDAARQMFGDALDYAPVRLWAQPFGFDRVFLAGRWFGRDWIVWRKRDLKPDYAPPGANFGDLAPLIHEQVHVWQAQRGVTLALAKLKAGDALDSYAYAIGDGTRWEDLNIE